MGVGANGRAWVVNRAGEIFRRNGEAWTRVPVGLVAISVDPQGNPWGVNAGDQIYRMPNQESRARPG